MRGARREGGTGVTAINSSPIGPPLILLRSYAFFPFLLLSLSLFFHSQLLLLLLLLLLILFVPTDPVHARYFREPNTELEDGDEAEHSSRAGLEDDEGGCCDRSGTRNNGMRRGDPLLEELS